MNSKKTLSVPQMFVLFLIFILLLQISSSTNCIKPSDCIRSLEDWQRHDHGIKYIETASGRDYRYCMHTFIEFADISLNASLIFVKFWYNTNPKFPGHAVIEIIFELNGKYIVVINEGYNQKGNGMVVCHQIYSNDQSAGSKYLALRSKQYQLLLSVNMIKNIEKNYRDMFDGAIKDVNEEYVHQKWIPSDVIKGEIVLGHGCLWYACNLFAKLIGISAKELLNNPNISMPIVQLLTNWRPNVKY